MSLAIDVYVFGERGWRRDRRIINPPEVRTEPEEVAPPPPDHFVDCR